MHETKQLTAMIWQFNDKSYLYLKKQFLTFSSDCIWHLCFPHLSECRSLTTLGPQEAPLYLPRSLSLSHLSHLFTELSDLDCAQTSEATSILYGNK